MRQRRPKPDSGNQQARRNQHADPRAIRVVERQIGSKAIDMVDDPYSDRLRCDHPEVVDESRFAEELREAAEQFGRKRVVTFVDQSMREGLQEEGFEVEGVIPGFYRGESDCVVMGWATESARMECGDPEGVALTRKVLKAKAGTPGIHAAVETEQATPGEAEEIAALLGETFREYPTPSSDPAYVAKQISEGLPFRVVREDNQVVACASADVLRDAQTAELTDCATRPEHRGRGLMQRILNDLMDDLRQEEFPTAFTLARASIPGINVAFQRLGFQYRGQMARSCRIGQGLEDMNIWSRWL